MIQTWESICLRVGDFAWGWSLEYPRDLMLIAFGSCLGLFLHVIRQVTTDRQLLQQIAADNRRLKQLIRAARSANDREELRRFQHIRSLVRSRQSQVELVSVCASLCMLFAMTTWGQHRLANRPWIPGDAVQLTVSTPPSAVGEVIHVVPLGELQPVSGWVRTIQPDVVQGLPTGRAEWSFQIAGKLVPRAITIRWGTRTIEHHLIGPQSQPAEAVQRHDGRVETVVRPPPYRPLGILPERLVPGLPSWALLVMLVTGAVFLGLQSRNPARVFEKGG